jgi:hypothetical protein
MYPQAPNTQTFLPACLLPTACDYNGLDCFDPLEILIQKIHPHVRVERDSGMCVARDLYDSSTKHSHIMLKVKFEKIEVANGLIRGIKK